MTQLVVMQPEDLERLIEAAAERALSKALSGATITPRPEWLTIPEAANFLRVSTDTIRRKIDRGELVAKGSGKARVVRIGD